jgi:hypothetical protein
MEANCAAYLSRGSAAEKDEAVESYRIRTIHPHSPSLQKMKIVLKPRFRRHVRDLRP